METDKENTNKIKLTRIPVPMDPLPAIPKHLLQVKNVLSEVQRVPLGTIMQSNCQPSTNNTSEVPTVIQSNCVPSMNKTSELRSTIQSNCQPSTSKTHEVPTERRKSLTIDTRHVTLRSRNDDLDWDHNVFKDKNDTIICLSDDEDVKEDVNVKIVKDVANRDCIEPRVSATPTGKLLEPKGVRNIKRSLKRPHSRELQGLTPAQIQEKIDEKAKRKLFDESVGDILLSPDFWKKSYMTCMNRHYTEDLFEYLLSVERKPINVPKNISSITRACVINWLMKVNGPNGNPATIQAACWYLDSLLSAGNIKLKKLQLAATACYWIAMKLQGPMISASMLVKCSKNVFNALELMAAEKLILQRLKFPIQPVVPQEFITYLSWWCDNSHPGEIEVAATFLCLSGLMVDKRLCEEYPSVIAAAAVRNALLLLGKRQLMNDLELFHLYKEAAKKTVNMAAVCSVQRKAVRTIAATIYEYKAPLEHYGRPPNCIAQRIVNAANELAVFDTRCYPSERESLSFKL